MISLITKRILVSVICLIFSISFFQLAMALDGPVQNLPLGMTVEDSETLDPEDPSYGEQWGRDTGRTMEFTIFQASQYDQLIWRVTNAGIAFDGEITAGSEEVLAYDRIEDGKAVWIGQTQVEVLNESTSNYELRTVNTKFILTVTDTLDSLIPFTFMPDGQPYIDIRNSLTPNLSDEVYFKAKLEMKAQMPSHDSTTGICPYVSPMSIEGLYYPALDVFDCLHTNPIYQRPVITEFEYGLFYELLTLSLEEHDEHMEALVNGVQDTANDIKMFTQFLYEDWPGTMNDLRSQHSQTQTSIGSLSGMLFNHGTLLNDISFKVDNINTNVNTLPDLSNLSVQLDQIEEQTSSLPSINLLLLLFGIETSEVDLPPDPTLPPFSFVEQVSDLYQAINFNITSLISQLQEKDQIIADINSQMNSMYTQEQLDQVVANAMAAKDEVIAAKDQIINQLIDKIKSMYTQGQVDQILSAICPGKSESAPGRK